MRGAAIVCTVLVACGGEGPHEPAPVVTVRVLGSGVPVAGVRVWFQARDASLVYETETDARGEASAFVEGGAIVNVLTTYLVDSNPTAQLRTFVETRVGDVLVIDEPAEDVASRAVQFELPPPTGTETYAIRTACSLDAFVPPSSTITLAGCDDELAFVITSTSEINVPLGYMYLPPAPIANGATIDLRARTFEPYVRLPVTLASFGTRHMAIFEPALVYEHALIPLPSATVPVVDGAATWSAKTVAEDSSIALATTLVGPAGIDVVIAWSDAPIELTLDGAQLLPPVGAPQLAADASTLVWPAVTGADLVELRLDSPTVPQSWRIIAPMTGAALTLPVLPPALAGFSPQPGDYTDFGGKLVRSSAGYDGLRANVMNARAHPLIAGPSGHTVVRPFVR